MSDDLIERLEDWETCGWNEIIQLRKDAAARTRELEAALRRIDDLNKTRPDENGHTWAASDLINQEIVAALSTCAPAPTTPTEAELFLTLCRRGIVEGKRAAIRFPQPNYVISKIAEEAGEVVKAAIHCAEGREKASEVKAEMTQLIAMLYRLWVEGDEVHGLRAIAGEGE